MLKYTCPYPSYIHMIALETPPNHRSMICLSKLGDRGHRQQTQQLCVSSLSEVTAVSKFPISKRMVGDWGKKGICKPFQTLPMKSSFPKVNFIVSLEHRKPTRLLQRVWIFFPFGPLTMKRRDYTRWPIRSLPAWTSQKPTEWKNTGFEVKQTQIVTMSLSRSLLSWKLT